MTPHEILAWLMVPGFESAGQGGADRDRDNRKAFGAVPRKRLRPLSSFSDYVCDELGLDNQRVSETSLTGGELFAIADCKLAAVPPSTWENLLAPDRTADRRVALLDLVWTLRSLDIANAGDPQYPVRKRESELFGLAKKLADMEWRHPALSWSDIGIYHPINDPRTFLAPSEARDQEILMYSAQYAMELMFKRVLEIDWTHPTRQMLSDLVFDLNASLKALRHLSRVRTVGQFYQLDPYLGANGEYRGHATGAFSAWTLLMAIFLAENQSFTTRLCDQANRKGFDRDAARHIDRVDAGTFTPLGSHLAATALTRSEKAELEVLHGEARRVFTLFLHSHRGAIKRHAPVSFTDLSPTDPTLTNRESIREAIDDMAWQSPAYHSCADSGPKLSG
jgi:hypothetical protein